MEKWAVLAFLLSTVATANAQSTSSSIVGARPGYVFDVEGERNQKDVELVLIDPPPPEPTLKQKIFDEKLTKDIRTEYQYRFGTTAMEQTINAPQNREDSYYYKGDTTVTADKYQEYQHSFAEYVGRKVTENQVDKFFNSDSDLKPIYQYKDKLSNFTMKTDNGYKVKWHYNLSGNTAEMELENPYKVFTKVTVRFLAWSPKTQEEILEMGYNINKQWSVSSNYKCYDGFFQATVSRKLTSTVSTSLTGITTAGNAGDSVPQTMGLIGISWSQ